MADQFFVYITANQPRGSIYIGMTNDLVRRIAEHRQKVIKGFTSKYWVSQLVWYEVHSDPREAIRREKQLKSWKRDWKVQLIEKTNPRWLDLWEEITGDQNGPRLVDPRVKPEDDGR